MRVLLATLTPATVSAHYCDSLAELLENPLPAVKVTHVLAIGGPMLGHTRNIVSKGFLSSVSDYLLFVDSDIKFTRNDLKLLLDCNQNICGARYYGYSPDRDETYPTWKPVDASKHEGMIECYHVGMGFTLISRKALEALGVRPEESWPFGYTQVDGLAGSTEDVPFCHRAREAGLKVFVNTDARVYHDKSRLV